jgi:pimeloyl-ACP methyl ester carboxylesterase
MPQGIQKASKLSCLGMAILASVTSVPAWSKDVPKCSVADYEAPPQSMVNEDRFTVEIRGVGPDVILIPGMATPRDVWSKTVDSLAKCYRFHSVQLRGFGDAGDANATGPVLEPFVTELAEYLNKLPKKTGKAPIVVGHSMGGLAGLKLARLNPELVSKLIVVDAVPNFAALIPGLGSADPETVERAATQMRNAIASRYGKAPNEAEVEASIAGMALDATSLKAMKAWSLAADSRVVAQAVYDDLVTDMRSELPAIKTPVLVLVAWNSGMPFTETQVLGFFRQQFAGLPILEVKTVTESAHFIMLDQPQKFQSELMQFINAQ